MKYVAHLFWGHPMMRVCESCEDPVSQSSSPTLENSHRPSLLTRSSSMFHNPPLSSNHRLYAEALILFIYNPPLIFHMPAGSYCNRQTRYDVSRCKLSVGGGSGIFIVFILLACRASFEFQAECYKWWQLLPKCKRNGWLERTTYFDLWARMCHVSAPDADFTVEVQILRRLLCQSHHQIISRFS